MKPQTVHIGYEVGTGESVEIPISHLCVTGQTQLSGKTTTLEALISRSELKAIAFVTKRGEGAFRSDYGGNKREHYSIAPFFRHKADWQFVSEILGAVLNEKLKYERYWMIKISRGAKSLFDVLANAEKWLEETKKSEDTRVLTTIIEYFKLFMPELEALPFTDKLKLAPGINVMDLSGYSTPLQMLVISAVVEEVYQHHEGVVTLIPEAWEFVPQGKNSPAKAACVSLIRKGGGLKNFVWIDSQDLAGVEKVIVKAAGVYLLGVQREANEVKRTLEHIPRVPEKLKVEDIMTLEKGQFWVCFGNTVRKVYVQPAWMTDQLAREVALGHRHTLPEFAEHIRRSEPPLGSRIVNITPPRREDYGAMPAGLDYAIDDGSEQGVRRTQLLLERAATTDSRHSSQIEAEAKETVDMDARERDGYEATIAELKKQVKALQDELARGPEARAGLHTRVDPDEDKGLHFDSPFGDMGTAQFDRLVHAVAERVALLLPTNGGVVKVEPREVVLKSFQTAEINRLLEKTEALSVWQKQVLKYVEAKGSQTEKVELLKRILGKSGASVVADYKQRYAEADQLANAGYLRRDSSGRLYPNLKEHVQVSLEPYRPSESDITDVVGQVLLRLN